MPPEDRAFWKVVIKDKFLGPIFTGEEHSNLVSALYSLFSSLRTSGIISSLSFRRLSDSSILGSE